MREEDRLKAAFVCKHVAAGGMPILYAVRDAPIDESDSGWQFLCGVYDHDPPAQPQMWALKNVVKDDFVLTQFVELPAGTVLTRRTQYGPWSARGRTE